MLGRASEGGGRSLRWDEERGSGFGRSEGFRRTRRSPASACQAEEGQENGATSNGATSNGATWNAQPDLTLESWEPRGGQRRVLDIGWLVPKGYAGHTGLKWEKDGQGEAFEQCRGEEEEVEGAELKMRKAKIGRATSSDDEHGAGGTRSAREDLCKFPDHLIESVVARLPVQSTFRFRCVSKAWRDVIHSPTFLRAYSDAPLRATIWCLVRRTGRFGPPNVALFDPQANKWLRIALPSPLRDINWHATAADGGLVCYFGYENRSRTLFVVNPLTRSLRRLPPVHKTSSHISVLKMVMEDRSKSAYKVFVAGMLPSETDEGGGDSLGVEVYNSLTDRWHFGGIIPAKYPRLRTVYSGGFLYVRCYDQKSLLLMLDTHTEIWHRIYAPLPQSLEHEELVHYQGDILLVGLLAENYNIESVCIWELQRHHGQRNFSWKQVESMPKELFDECLRDREYFECQSGDRIMMKCCQYGDMILCVASNNSNRGPLKVVGFDLALKAWRKLPEMFKGRECRAYRVAEGIFFESRLDVFA